MTTWCIGEAEERERTSVGVCPMESHSESIRRRHLGTRCLGRKIIIAQFKSGTRSIRGSREEQNSILGENMNKIHSCALCHRRCSHLDAPSVSNSNPRIVCLHEFVLLFGHQAHSWFCFLERKKKTYEHLYKRWKDLRPGRKKNGCPYFLLGWHRPTEGRVVLLEHYEHILYDFSKPRCLE